MPKGTPRTTSKWTPSNKLVPSDVGRQEIERRIDELSAFDLQWGLEDQERSILEKSRKALARDGTISGGVVQGANAHAPQSAGPRLVTCPQNACTARAESGRAHLI